ncbi:MAG: helix-turn-helix domain-containing protein [Bacteroidales bacterium]|nr:helix-turn-helix domain-containing protein [Bacteroidales bacterium]OQB71475.1 MAG: Helix-turn-helix domain protein [Deltaproteobacteria bacterium ADurb.Bin135]
MMIDEKSAVAVVGCAEMLDIHVTTLYRWEKQNYLIPIRIGTKVRYRKSDIEKLLSNRTDK